MWIVLCEPKTGFPALDRCVHCVVEDEDIFAYQKELAGASGMAVEFLENNSYIQPFVIFFREDIKYFVKKYTPWSSAMLQETDRVFQAARSKPETQAVLRFQF
jgi:hypothetical protein